MRRALESTFDCLLAQLIELCKGEGARKDAPVEHVTANTIRVLIVGVEHDLDSFIFYQINLCLPLFGYGVGFMRVFGFAFDFCVRDNEWAIESIEKNIEYLSLLIACNKGEFRGSRELQQSLHTSIRNSYE